MTNATQEQKSFFMEKFAELGCMEYAERDLKNLHLMKNKNAPKWKRIAHQCCVEAESIIQDATYFDIDTLTRMGSLGAAELIETLEIIKFRKVSK